MNDSAGVRLKRKFKQKSELNAQLLQFTLCDRIRNFICKRYKTPDNMVEKLSFTHKNKKRNVS